MYLLEIRVTSIRTLLDVFRYSLTELLHSALDRLTIRRDLLRIGHIFQPKIRPVREVYGGAK